MRLLEFLFDLLDFFHHWRFNVCFYGGIVLAILIAANIPQEPLDGIIGVAIIVGASIVGRRWESES